MNTVIRRVVKEDAADMDLTDEQWQALEPVIGEIPRRGWPGRPWRSRFEYLAAT